MNTIFSFFDQPMWVIIPTGLAIGWVLGTVKKKLQ